MMEGEERRTSRENSSGPARGSKRYGSASIPGVGGSETRWVSGERMAS